MSRYLRFGIFDLDQVLPFIQGGAEPRQFPGVHGIVGVSSLRLQTFRYKGLGCVWCGITGLYFAAEHSNFKNPQSPCHLNLYAHNQKGEEVLMTHDHIHPKTLGGVNQLDNAQTMCTHCNRRKDAMSNEDLKGFGIIRPDGTWTMDGKALEAMLRERNIRAKALSRKKNKEFHDRVRALKKNANKALPGEPVEKRKAFDPQEFALSI